MNEKTTRLVTAESVRAGHPDKFCDQVADAILDAHLRLDPNARVAVEVFAMAGKIIVGGEITSQAKVDCSRIVAGVINRIGYTMSDLCGDPHGLLELEVCLHEQSPDISAAVGKSMLDAGEALGAGDQGIMVGYAASETAEYMPLPVVLAHRICKRLDELKPTTPWLGADGKAQITVAYENGVPIAVTAVVVSLQHDAEIDHKSIRRFIGKEVLGKVLPRELLKEDTSILINPSGKFVLGGPAADAGLTGRKLAVDQYGPVAHIGGGALSGKDPTKVDRSGAYAEAGRHTEQRRRLHLRRESSSRDIRPPLIFQLIGYRHTLRRMLTVKRVLAVDDAGMRNETERSGGSPERVCNLKIRRGGKLHRQIFPRCALGADRGRRYHDILRADIFIHPAAGADTYYRPDARHVKFLDADRGRRSADAVRHDYYSLSVKPCIIRHILTVRRERQRLLAQRGNMPDPPRIPADERERRAV